MRVAALVLAAGRGERLGHALPKGFVPVAGRPLLQHSLERLARAPEIDLVQPVVGAADLARYAALAASLEGLSGLAPAVAGGAERQDSMRAGLAALPADVGLVAVHDAARPAVALADVARVVAAARRDGAAILAVPARDTIKRVRGGRVVETPPRDECWAAQTPQVFRREILEEALAKATAENRLGTDDAELVEALGVAVTIVEGDPRNLKLTNPGDVAVLEQTLAEEGA